MSDKTNQRRFTKSYEMFGGEATIWLMPIITLRHHMAVDDAKALFLCIDDDKWFDSLDASQRIFYLLEGCIVDLECEELAEDHEHYHNVGGLQVYFESRSKSMADNWECFTSYITWDCVLELFKAYNATRRVLPEIKSEILSEPPPDIQTDPKETGSGRKRTAKKSTAT